MSRPGTDVCGHCPHAERSCLPLMMFCACAAARALAGRRGAARRSGRRPARLPAGRRVTRRRQWRLPSAVLLPAVLLRHVLSGPYYGFYSPSTAFTSASGSATASKRVYSPYTGSGRGPIRQYPTRTPTWLLGHWAWARLEMKPRDAKVFVDGYWSELVDPFDGVFRRLDLPTGEHEIVVYCRAIVRTRQRSCSGPARAITSRRSWSRFRPGRPTNRIRSPCPAANRGGEPRITRDPRDPDAAGSTNPPIQDRRDPRQPRDPGRTVPMPDRAGDRRPPEGSDFGTLNMRVQPADAIVIIDGERWDSPEGGSRLSVQLLAGPHRDRSAQGRLQALHLHRPDPAWRIAGAEHQSAAGWRSASAVVGPWNAKLAAGFALAASA